MTCTASLADVLAGLDAAGGPRRVCKGWTVRHVVAHLTLPAAPRPALSSGCCSPRVPLELASSAGRSARRRAPPDERLLALRSNRLHAWRPPGGGAAGALVHALVHSLDVTIPLAIEREPRCTSVRVALDALVAPTSLKHFGVDLTASSCAPRPAWSHGSGTPVQAAGRGRWCSSSVDAAPLPRAG